MVNYRNLDDTREVLQILKKSRDYVMKVDGVSPNYSLAKSVFTERPKILGPNQKKVIGISFNNQLIGFSDILLNFPDSKTVHIGIVILIPDKRRNGIGTQYVHELENAAIKLGYKKIRLAVVKTNKEIRQFWLKIGFKTTNEIKSFSGENMTSTCEIFEKTPLTLNNINQSTNVGVLFNILNT